MPEAATQFTPDWISPPGDTITDLLEERGWTQAEFAERTGFTTKHVSLLINGKAPVTDDTALRLERVLGSTARFWLTREAAYRESILRREESQTLNDKVDWLAELPIGDMLRFGWISAKPSRGQLVGECLRFFGVASIEAWRQRYATPLAAFRASKSHTKDGGAVSAWLRQGERVAQSTSCAPFDKQGFLVALESVRKLTLESDPAAFVPKLQQACTEVGVVVALVPAPKGCPVSGAATWITSEKALLMLSLRHKSNDHLWFSLGHEAGHLVLHGKRMTFIDVENTLGDAHETEADHFAANWLIPKRVAGSLAQVGKSERSVRTFAASVGIAPGIVVGRMQKEGHLPWTHLNGLKIRYKWEHET